MDEWVEGRLEAIVLLGGAGSNGWSRSLDFSANVLERLFERPIHEWFLFFLLFGVLGRRRIGGLLAAQNVAVSPVEKILQPLVVLETNFKTRVWLHAPLFRVFAVREAMDIFAAGPPITR